MTSIQNNGYLSIHSHERPSLKSSYLTSQQQSFRLRHLSQIAACHLRNDKAPQDITEVYLSLNDSNENSTSGYYFTLSIGRKQILYTSQFINSKSPNWDDFNLKKTVPEDTLTAKGVIINIWYKDVEGNSYSVLSWGVYFSGLSLIGEDFYKVAPFVASNTILFRLKGLLYSAPDSRYLENTPDHCKVRVPLYRSVSLAKSEVSIGCSVESMARLQDLKRREIEIKRKIEEKRKVFERLGISKSAEKLKLMFQIERTQISICELSKEVNKEYERLIKLKELSEAETSSNQEKAMEILANYHWLNKTVTKYMYKESEIPKLIEELKELMKKLENRRIHLLQQIPHIFPITDDLVHKDKKYICGIHLPEAEYYDGFKESEINVSLGYVAQLIVVLSNIISIPLPYPINLYGSTSSICDLTTNMTHIKDTTFPLHSRSKDKNFFEYAVFLLTKNIAQLRWTCGLPTPNLRSTLFNVKSFINGLCSNDKVAIIPDVAQISPLKPISYVPASNQSLIPPVNVENIHGQPNNAQSAIQKLPLMLRPVTNASNSKPVSITAISHKNQNKYSSNESRSASSSPKQLPAEILGLGEDDRKKIDESFNAWQDKFCLKKSNSSDRLNALSVKVNVSPSKNATPYNPNWNNTCASSPGSQSNVDSLSKESDSEEKDKESLNSDPCDRESLNSEGQKIDSYVYLVEEDIDDTCIKNNIECIKEDIKTNYQFGSFDALDDSDHSSQDEELSKVFSRTSALASQNISFNLSFNKK